MWITNDPGGLQLIFINNACKLWLFMTFPLTPIQRIHSIGRNYEKLHVEIKLFATKTYFPGIPMNSRIYQITQNLTTANKIVTKSEMS